MDWYCLSDEWRVEVYPKNALVVFRSKDAAFSLTMVEIEELNAVLKLFKDFPPGGGA